MAGHRRERQIQRWREALDRGADGGGPEGDLTPAQVEDLFFHDHEDLVRGLEEALARAGAQEALLALARHLEEDRDHWLLRLECIQARPALRGRGEALEADYREVFAAHFRRLGAAGAQGERIARLEADLLRPPCGAPSGFGCRAGAGRCCRCWCRRRWRWCGRPWTGMPGGMPPAKGRAGADGGGLALSAEIRNHSFHERVEKGHRKSRLSKKGCLKYSYRKFTKGCRVYPHIG